MRALIFSLLSSIPVWAQLGGPMIGYVPEGAHIRPMYGLPAAGAIGGAFNAGRDFAQITISPKQNFALATAADTGQLLVVRPGVSLTPVNGATPGADQIVMSPRGSAAALWLSSNSHVQVISGLPDAPTVRDIDVTFLNTAPGGLNAAPGDLAISDDGQWAAGIWSSGVYAFGPNGEVIPLQTDPGVTAIAFFHQRHDLALATALRATSIMDVGGSAQMSVLYDYSAQPLAPVGLALSFDNQRAVLADGAGALLTISLADGTAAATDCGCTPQGAYGLGGALFRLTGTSGDLKLFDAAAGAVLIVPPALAQTSGGQQ